MNFLCVLFSSPYVVIWVSKGWVLLLQILLSMPCSTLEAQEACWQTNRMIKMSQAQVFSFILNNSHCLPQTPELHGQVRHPRSGWARGMTRARETCWMVETQMQKWPRKQCCLTHGWMLTMWTCCFPRDGISLCSGLPHILLGDNFSLPWQPLCTFCSWFCIYLLLSTCFAQNLGSGADLTPLPKWLANTCGYKYQYQTGLVTPWTCTYLLMFCKLNISSQAHPSILP